MRTPISIKTETEPTENECHAENLRRYIAVAWAIYRRLRMREDSRALDVSIPDPYDPDRKVDSPPYH